MGRVFKALFVILISVTGLQAAWSAEPFSILDAINQAVKTNPGVGEATANRRATEAELHQSQGALLPQIRLDASAGPEMLNQYVVPPPVNNGAYLHGREASDRNSPNPVRWLVVDQRNLAANRARRRRFLPGA